MKHGIVTSKKVDADGHLELTVQSERAGVTWSRVKVAQTQPGSIQNIEGGWHVVLDQCDDGLWICLGVLNTDPTHIPSSLNEREHTMKFNDGTEISARLNDAGEYDVTISASGDVTIGDAANAVNLAVQNHTHPESGGGTTGTPNESGTETTAE